MKKYYSAAGVSAFISILFSAFTMLIAIDHNSMQEYCIYSSYESKSSKEPERTFVKYNGKYELYDNNKHPYPNNFYIKYLGSEIDINASNWRSQGDPCKLKFDVVIPEAFIVFIVSFIPLFLILSFLIFIISKICNFIRSNKKET